MASAVITLKVMLKSPEVKPENIREQVMPLVKDFNGGKEIKTKVEPIAFGLKALIVIFVLDESIGTSDELEKRIQKLSGVQSVECTDVRRAVG